MDVLFLLRIISFEFKPLENESDIERGAVIGVHIALKGNISPYAISIGVSARVVKFTE